MPRHPLQGTSYSRTIVIGLGSTGLQILQSIQDLWYEQFGNTRRDLIWLLNIESDQSNRLTGTDDGTMIEQIFIKVKLNDFEKAVDVIQKRGNRFETRAGNIIWEWEWAEKIKWNKSMATAGENGLGGLRVGGRLALYGLGEHNAPCEAERIFSRMKGINDNTSGDGWQRLSQANNEVQKKICEALGFRPDQWVEKDKVITDGSGLAYSENNPVFNPNTKVIVVGSLTGGTCSGMFIDIGYIIQGALGIGAGQLAKRLTGIFLIPPVEGGIGVNYDKPRANANTFGSLYEIRKLLRLYTMESYPMPYGMIYIAAPEYNASNLGDIHNLKGLVDMTALRIFTYCLGFESVADSDLVDEFLHDPSNYIFTFGTGAVIFPKHVMVLKGASDLMSRMCSRLLQSNHYLDQMGTEVKISPHEIKDHVSNMADEYFVDIIKTMKATPKHLKNALDVEIEKWTNEIAKNENAKYELYEAFTRTEGYFIDFMKGKEDDIFNRIVSKINDDMTSQWRETTNLSYVKYVLNGYLLRFGQIRKLLKLQDCDMVLENLKDKLNDILTHYKKCKSIDKKTLLNVLIDQLHDEFVLHHCYKLIDRITNEIQQWKSNLDTTMAILTEAIKKFDGDFETYDEKLKNDSNYAPIINVFYKSKQEDYRSMLNNFVGSDLLPRWEQFEPKLTVSAFWDQVKSGIVPIDKMSEIVKKGLHVALLKYLHPERQGDDSSQGRFNILDQVSKGGNREAMAELFQRVRVGFIKQKNYNDNSRVGALNIGRGGRIPRYLISSETEDTLRNIRNSYPELSVVGEECNVKSLPLIEDMLVYTRDISSINLDQLEKFEELKSDFLTSHADSLDDKDWILLRLTMGGEVDYTLVEGTKNWELSQILKFVRYFWFDGKRVLTDADYRVPTIRLKANGDPDGNGCFVDTHGLRHLYFTNPVSLQVINLDIDLLDSSQFNEICKFDKTYKSFIQFMIENTAFSSTEARRPYGDKLYQHYRKRIVPNLPGDKRDETFQDIFSQNAEVNEETGTISNFAALQSTDKLMGYMMRILGKK